jgi:tetratricopeptide (TPR) repeat protein
MREVLCVFALASLAACAARLAPLPPVGAPPQFPELVYPDAPAELQGSNVVSQHDIAWRWLQAGDRANAEREFAAVLRNQPGFYPAETGLGLVRLTSHDYEAALGHFEHALVQSQAYAPALVGRGEAQLALKRDRDALQSFHAALAANPSLDLAKSRVEVLDFRLLQASLSSARQAAAAGRAAEAIGAYQEAIAASPQSAFLYREIGGVERGSGNLETALEHYRKATELEPNDASAWREIGEILEARHEHAAAGEAYQQALGIEPSADIRDRINRSQALLALARLPVDYRRIPESPAITRGELAALVGVHFEKLLDQTGHPDAVVVTDTREHWAASWIFAVTRAGVLDVYPNHTFQPDSIVRRSDLAQAVSQLLRLLSQQSPVLAEKWKTPQPEIADVDPGNLNYAAISVAIESGVLPLLEGSTFQLSRSVSGAEAVAAMERLEELLR